MRKNGQLISIVAVAFAVSLLLAGCGESQKSATSPAAETTPAAEAVKAAAESPKSAGERVKAATSLVQLTCPVMGGQIDKGIFFDYEGQRIYFCCSGCVETFKKDPEKYLKRLEEKGEALEKISESTEKHKEHAH